VYLNSALKDANGECFYENSSKEYYLVIGIKRGNETITFTRQFNVERSNKRKRGLRILPVHFLTFIASQSDVFSITKFTQISLYRELNPTRIWWRGLKCPCQFFLITF